MFLLAVPTVFLYLAAYFVAFLQTGGPSAGLPDLSLRSQVADIPNIRFSL